MKEIVLFKNIRRIFLLLVLLLSPSCKQHPSDITAVCELMPDATYSLKWETFPPIEGVVKIFESSNPDSFPATPVYEENIASKYKTVLATPRTRSFFRLVFNKRQSIIVANRIIPMHGIPNFRDFGGYFTRDNRQIRWGRLFRSGSFSGATAHDAYLLKMLRLKTFIDFRTEQEHRYYPNRIQPAQVYNLPLKGSEPDTFFDEILSKRTSAANILTYDYNTTALLLENNSEYFAKMFDVLLDENNYPVCLSCFAGKDRSALAAALVLLALGVDEETVLEDYMLSNQYIDYGSLVWFADALADDMQESITALYSSHEETLRNIFNILKKDGSINIYLEKKLKLTPKKREQLQKILLY
ncbi:MAG: tyrosine-protein phosphatase [Candidatus Symbiothrix sp.]|jgi:protein-tyrosine phosphatase|nr:tyrosine-protein phosphatase [Candidatus Symbiothrix sp.]